MAGIPPSRMITATGAKVGLSSSTKEHYSAPVARAREATVS